LAKFHAQIPVSAHSLCNFRARRVSVTVRGRFSLGHSLMSPIASGDIIAASLSCASPPAK
jgi:hypothetical protein